MTKYWAFARGGAWRNPKPTGGLYVCEQIRLDARSGNDANLTLEAVTTRELCSKVPKLGGEHKRLKYRELVADNGLDAGANPCL